MNLFFIKLLPVYLMKMNIFRNLQTHTHTRIIFSEMLRPHNFSEILDDIIRMLINNN